MGNETPGRRYDTVSITNEHHVNYIQGTAWKELIIYHKVKGPDTTFADQIGLHSFYQLPETVARKNSTLMRTCNGSEKVEIKCWDLLIVASLEYYKFKNAKSEKSHGNRENKPLSYFKLFQYATKTERFYVIVSLFLAIIAGCIPPVINIIYGEFCSLLVERQHPGEGVYTEVFFLKFFGGGKVLRNASYQDRMESLEEDSLAWALACSSITGGLFLFCLCSLLLLCFTTSRQISRIKVLYFRSILCKDMNWFDTRLRDNFAAVASQNLIVLEKGMGDILCIFTYHFTVGIINILVCFIYGWLLTLALLVVVTPFMVCALFLTKFQSKLALEESKALSEASNVVEEVFTYIKTVVAFGGENKEIQRYTESLKKVGKLEMNRGLLTGFSNGVLWLIIYCSYSVAFVFGVRLMETSFKNHDAHYNPAVLLIIFFGIISALTSLGYTTGRVSTFSMACGAAASVFQIINSKTLISPCAEKGFQLDNLQGEIEFKQVHFEYPSRLGTPPLKGISLKVNAGETVAFVGESGGGKSTILQLIQRLYDPVKGKILLDGQDLRSLDVSWLRQQLGVVSQDPVLFTATIRDNIRFGNMSATQKEIDDASINAGAYKFITELKDGFDTIVSQKGSSLSAGERQKIAIARAIVKNPKILLLDEATSALDAVEDKQIEDYLYKGDPGRTTLIVTHSISRTARADRIIVVSKGVIVEEGTFNELSKADGIFKSLLDTEGKFKVKTEVEKVETKPGVNVRPSGFPFPGPRGRFSSVSGLKRVRKSDSVPIPEEAESIKVLEILKWARPDMLLIFVGSVASLICGAALPTVCILFAEMYGFLSLKDFQLIKEKTDFYASLLVCVGLCAGVCVFGQMACFAAVSVNLGNRLRVRSFKSLIYQEINYFEEEKNSVGPLTFRLSQDVAKIQTMFDVRLGILVQAISTAVIGIAVSFSVNTELTTITMAAIPFLFLGVYIESMFTAGFFSLENKALENASKIAVEVINSIRTVASLAREVYFIEKYTQEIEEGRKHNVEKFWVRSFAFAIGQAAPYLGYAVGLWYGGKLVAEEELPYSDVIKVSELLIFGAWSVAQSLILGPSFRGTKGAANRLSFIFSRKPKVVDGSASLPRTRAFSRPITFSKVYFFYPSRQNSWVLRNFNLRIEAGKTIAIMGASGTGKSTIIQLLLRFYDPDSGIISLSRGNIRTYKLSSLRRAFGLVSQTSELFERTIRENIAYGDNTRNISLDEIKAAAKSANIHTYIEGLPLGYDTTLGAEIQLSGGEKRRIIIARMLVRDPEIMLLDEATSALDPESESLVQDVLDQVSANRTTITFGHRFSAARKADVIYFLQNGQIKEFGTYDELMRKKGLFYQAQSKQEEKNLPGSSKE